MGRLLVLAWVFVVSGCAIGVTEERLFNPPDWSEYDFEEPRPTIYGEDVLLAIEFETRYAGGELKTVQMTLEHGAVPSADGESVAWSFASLPIETRPVIIDCTGMEADRLT